jgi:hypothetical protein
MENQNADNFEDLDAIIANPDVQNDGEEEGEGNSETPDVELEPRHDYQKKFSESTRENQRIMAEMKAKDAELEQLRNERENNSETLYPGFEELSEVEQKNLINYTNMVEKRALAKLNNDPAIAFARQTYNEKTFDKSLDALISKFPDLKDNKEDFKAQYFNPNNVPKNIDEINEKLAKIYLFDKAKNIGAEEEKSRANRLDTERAKGGARTPNTNRSLDEWQALAVSNPAKFAKLSKEYKNDTESGKLQE